MAEKIASLYAEIGADTRGLKRGLDETKGGLQNAKRGFTDFRMSLITGFAAIGGAAFIAKKAFDFTKEGAQLDYMSDKFDKLATSIGVTSSSLMTELRAATRGMVADSDLVSSATNIMSLGLAKTRDQVVRLSRVAGALGMDMNQLVLTLTNQTTMRFDQLNVAVDGFDERLKALKDTGMDTNAAFTEAFLRQAEDQLRKVGDAADSATAKFVTLDVAVKNYFDYLKRGAAESAESGTGIIGTMVRQLDLLVQIRQAADDGIITTKEQWMMELQLFNERVALEDISLKLAQAYMLLDDEGKNMARGLAEQARASEEAGQAMYFSGRKAGGAAGEYDTLERAVINLGRAGGGAAREIGAAGDEVKRLGGLAAEARPGVVSLLDGMDRHIDSPIADFIKDLEWYRGGGAVFERTFGNIKGALEAGEITPAEADAYMKELYIAVTDFQEELGQIDATQAAQNINDTMGASIADAKNWLDGTDSVESALTALTSKEWFIAVTYRVSTQGTPPQGAEVIPLDPGLVPEDGGAHGLSGIVPPGYPGDSYLIGATSGEHVQITPQGGGTGSGFSGDIINNIYAAPGMDTFSLANYTALVMGQKARRSAIAGAGYVGS